MAAEAEAMSPEHPTALDGSFVFQHTKERSTPVLDSARLAHDWYRNWVTIKEDR